MGKTTTLLENEYFDRLLNYKFNNMIGFKFYSTKRNNDGVEFIENYLIVNDGSPYLESLYRHIKLSKVFLTDNHLDAKNKYIILNKNHISTFMNDQDLKDTGFFIMSMTELEIFNKKLDIFNLEDNFRKKYGHKLYNKTRSHKNENKSGKV